MMDEQILIEDGQVFDGSWEQLDDCFGLVNKNES